MEVLDKFFGTIVKIAKFALSAFLFPLAIVTAMFGIMGLWNFVSDVFMKAINFCIYTKEEREDIKIQKSIEYYTEHGVICKSCGYAVPEGFVCPVCGGRLLNTLLTSNVYNSTKSLAQYDERRYKQRIRCPYCNSISRVTEESDKGYQIRECRNRHTFIYDYKTESIIKDEPNYKIV